MSDNSPTTRVGTCAQCGAEFVAAGVGKVPRKCLNCCPTRERSTRIKSLENIDPDLGRTEAYKVGKSLMPDDEYWSEDQRLKMMAIALQTQPDPWMAAQTCRLKVTKDQASELAKQAKEKYPRHHAGELSALGEDMLAIAWAMLQHVHATLHLMPPTAMLTAVPKVLDMTERVLGGFNASYNAMTVNLEPIDVEVGGDE